MLNLRGQTGNNMFQYAAGKTLADKKGFRFCFRTRFDARLKGKRTGHLYKYFVLNGETPWQLALWRSIYALTPGRKSRRYRNRVKAYTENKTDEIYDTRFYAIADGTAIQGAFQSERYFRDNRDNVLKWFTPRRRYLQRVDALEQRIPVPADRRCCIHIRQSDYQRMLDKNDAVGWLLPVAYYKLALRDLPPDLFYVIVTDAPGFAAKVFENVPHKWISERNPAVVDLCLFTRCRYNVIANSTFSWWGAWLNQIADKVIIAPQYHLGWKQSLWFPDAIKVKGWRYVNVLAALKEYGDIEHL
jgi:hypothetical protein